MGGAGAGEGERVRVRKWLCRSETLSVFVHRSSMDDDGFLTMCVPMESTYDHASKSPTR